jgi:branched-chain amino acid transport system substrate-binding protein
LFQKLRKEGITMRKKGVLVCSAAALFFVGGMVISSLAGGETAVIGNEIIIGGLGPLTGPASNLGPMVELGGKLAARQINEAGGINGRMIKFVMGDTACSVNTGLAAVKKMIDMDNVFTFMGITCSHVGIAIRPTLEEEKRSLMVVVAQSDKILEPFSRYMFRIIPPTHISGPASVRWVMKYFPKKLGKVAIIYSKGDYGVSITNSVVDEYKKYAIEPIATESHKIGDTDYSAQLLKIKATNPDVLWILSYLKDVALILKQAHELGLECIKMGILGSDFSVVPALAGKEALRDFYGSTLLEDVIWGPKLKGFIEMYEKEYPEYMKNPSNPCMSDVSAYAGVKIIAEGLKRAGKDLTQDKFIKAMETLRDFRVPWYPPVTFTPTQHEGIVGLHFLRYVDGKAKIID